PASRKASAASTPKAGMTLSAVVRPKASDSTPARYGPAASPNKFWNSASTDEPVARTPGWTTSITMADTGPTVQVAMKPPNAISANCAGAGSVVPKAVTSTTIEATQSRAMVTSLRRGCRVPTRSTRAPQLTDPAAPHKT